MNSYSPRFFIKSYDYTPQICFCKTHLSKVSWENSFKRSCIFIFIRWSAYHYFICKVSFFFSVAAFTIWWMGDNLSVTLLLEVSSFHRTVRPCSVFQAESWTLKITTMFWEGQIKYMQSLSWGKRWEWDLYSGWRNKPGLAFIHSLLWLFDTVLEVDILGFKDNITHI